MLLSEQQNCITEQLRAGRLNIHVWKEALATLDRDLGAYDYTIALDAREDLPGPQSLEKYGVMDVYMWLEMLETSPDDVPLFGECDSKMHYIPPAQWIELVTAVLLK